jgi:hypothetical protein
MPSGSFSCMVPATNAKSPGSALTLRGSATRSRALQQEDRTPRRKRPKICPGSGRRTQKTGSSAFPEVQCSHCEYEGSPVEKYGEVLTRSHRPKGAWRDA